MRHFKQVLAPAGMVVGGATVVAGYISTALQMISWGLPVWAWQAIGASLFFLSVVTMLAGHSRRMEKFLGSPTTETSSTIPGSSASGRSIWWLFGIGKRLHEQERTIESHQRHYATLADKARGVALQLEESQREIGTLKSQVAEQQGVIQTQRETSLKLLQEKDDVIQGLQQKLDNRDSRLALRKRGDALVREGNILASQVTIARQQEIDNRYTEVINWVRQVYNFTRQPPLFCASDIIVGLGLEKAIEGRPSDELRTFEATLRTMAAEDFRKLLHTIIDQVCKRLLACLERLDRIT